MLYAFSYILILVLVQQDGMSLLFQIRSFSGESVSLLVQVKQFGSISNPMYCGSKPRASFTNGFTGSGSRSPPDC